MGSRVSQASPVVVGDSVLIGATETGGTPGLFAIDAHTGTRHWVYETTYGIKSAPAVAGGVIYLTTSMGSLYALT